MGAKRRLENTGILADAGFQFPLLFQCQFSRSDWRENRLQAISGWSLVLGLGCGNRGCRLMGTVTFLQSQHMKVHTNI